MSVTDKRKHQLKDSHVSERSHTELHITGTDFLATGTVVPIVGTARRLVMSLIFHNYIICTVSSSAETPVPDLQRKARKQNVVKHSQPLDTTLAHSTSSIPNSQNLVQGLNT